MHKQRRRGSLGCAISRETKVIGTDSVCAQESAHGIDDWDVPMDTSVASTRPVANAISTNAWRRWLLVLDTVASALARKVGAVRFSIRETCPLAVVRSQQRVAREYKHNLEVLGLVKEPHCSITMSLNVLVFNQDRASVS